MTTTITQIYAYSDEDRYEGRVANGKIPRLKIGETGRDAKTRVDEQDGTSQPVELIIKKVLFKKLFEREIATNQIKK